VKRRRIEFISAAAVAAVIRAGRGPFTSVLQRATRGGRCVVISVDSGAGGGDDDITASEYPTGRATTTAR